MQYTRLYLQNGIAAYGPTGRSVDHLFLARGTPQTPDLLGSLDKMVELWNSAAKNPQGVIQRSILFCQQIDPAKVGENLDRLFVQFPESWGRLLYWRSASFSGAAPDSFFPDTRFGATMIQVGMIHIGTPSGAVPASLDDFTISNDVDAIRLSLPNNTWDVDGFPAIDPLFVNVDAPNFASGALGLQVDWPKDVAAGHPAGRVNFQFTAAQDGPPPTGGFTAPSRNWSSRLVDRIEKQSPPSGTREDNCVVYLDPRDAQGQWFNGTLNSRLVFGNAIIHTSLFSPDGGQFAIRAQPSDGVARLGFIYDQIDAAQNMSSSGDVLFHPEGHYVIAGPAPALSNLNLQKRDMVAGNAATEFLDLSGATRIKFALGPAFFVDGQPKLDDRNGTVRTAHFQFADDQNPIAVDYHTQTSQTVFFQHGGPNNPLPRYRKEFATSAAAFPLFPWAGYKPDGGSPDPDLLGFETTHLAKLRLATALSHTSARAAVSALPRAEVIERNCVTPQGILAGVTATGRYGSLYFGNPAHSQSPDLVDFKLTINAPDSTAETNRIYDGVQAAIAGSQLFMVFRKTTAKVLRIFGPAATLHAPDFEFTVGMPDSNLTIPADQAALGCSAVIIKYFTGKSIKELLQDPTHWGCQPDLAPGGTSDIDKWIGGWPDPANSDAPGELQGLGAIWNDRNWQGILFLDLPIAGEPDIVAALMPGIVTDPQTKKPAIVASFFSVNMVPTKSTDVETPAEPKRPTSISGLIRYVKPADQDPASPKTDDREPGGSAASDAQRKYTYVVQKLAIEFAKSEVASFDAVLDVNFSHVFWDKVANPKPLTLNGSLERRNGKDVFSLICTNETSFNFGDSFIKELKISRAQLNVASTDSSGQLTVLIGIDALLTLNEKSTPFPFFHVKAIRLSSFGFEFDYLQASRLFKFRFKAGGISADIDFDPDGVDSLLSSLPFKLKGMTVAINDLVDIAKDLQFWPIPISGNANSKLQFGFLMDLDLGSLGKLAGDLKGFQLPAILGWAGGSNPGLVFGIQFPTISGKLDIGIQQFVRLRADTLNLQKCPAAGPLTHIGIQASGVRIVFLGKEWPQGDVAFAIFVPIKEGRNVSWAFGYQNGNSWYVGGGYRIKIPIEGVRDVKGVVKSFQDKLKGIDKNTDLCTLIATAPPSSDGYWSVIGKYDGAFKLGLAISDPDIYGIDLGFAGFDFDVLYTRVNDQLGIFSGEITLPDSLRTMQFGAATIRLPVFRVEIHTDGGYLLDFGYPWNNDFSRSAQVEVAIFLGSGGFYYGVTAAAASDLLTFNGGFGYQGLAPGDTTLDSIRAIRLGFAARVGIGRSFTIGILNAEASLTFFGSLEGAVAYAPGEGRLFHPTLYVLRGCMGLMLDIRATVDFVIIKASAHILAYADIGLELRRVLARNSEGIKCLITLPVIIFADVGLSVGVDVEIHIGCIDITIHLSFSTTWHFEQTLNGLGGPDPYPPIASQLNAERTLALLAADQSVSIWSPNYRYWTGKQNLTIYTTVLPCMAVMTENNQTGLKTCAVGVMMLPVDPVANGFGDLARFLAAWVLLNGPLSGNPLDYDTQVITYSAVADRLEQMRDDAFWQGFPDALLAALGSQFNPQLAMLTRDNTQSLTVLPPWPGSTFTYQATTGDKTATPAVVQMQKFDNQLLTADKAAFVEYCQHLITGVLSEIEQVIREVNPHTSNPLTVNPSKSLTWREIWSNLFTNLQT